MFIGTLYVVFHPGQHFPQKRQCFESCRWWNSAASVVIVSVEVYLYVYTSVCIIDFTQLSTQLRARVRCTSIEHAGVVLL